MNYNYFFMLVKYSHLIICYQHFQKLGRNCKIILYSLLILRISTARVDLHKEKEIVCWIIPQSSRWRTFVYQHISYLYVGRYFCCLVHLCCVVGSILNSFSFSYEIMKDAGRFYYIIHVVGSQHCMGPFNTANFSVTIQNTHSIDFLPWLNL